MLRRRVGAAARCLRPAPAAKTSVLPVFARPPAPPGRARGAAQVPAEAAAAAWDPSSFRDLLQQVSAEGRAEEPLLLRLRGEPAAAAAEEGDEDGGEAGGDLVDCAPSDFVLVAELCAARRLRDFVSLHELADRLAAGVPAASTDVLRRIATVYSTLGALNPPLFQSIAAAYLSAWGKASEAVDTEHLTAVARAFSVQRLRHEELFDAVKGRLQAGGAEAATPEQALSLLHSHAYLNAGDGLGGLWEQLEERARSPGLSKLSPGTLAELCHVLVLSRRADARQEELAAMLEALADPVLKADAAFWASSDGASLHKRVLLLRSVMRYLYRDTYRALPAGVAQAFRCAHRLEQPEAAQKPAVNFVRKVSHCLTKMKIGHLVNVERGAFVFDVMERDRKLIYECNHFDRYYVGTTEKIASMCLQERVAKAMGYRVVQVPHWHWTRITHKKQRASYIRMSRYYAIKDRRELTPRDDVPTDVTMTEFDFVGEYFFRKERPSPHWSWFQPRYDYRNRLPAEA